MQGTTEVKCVGENEERLERRKGKKTGKDPENSIDQKEKEDTGQKLEWRRICIPKIWGAKKRLRRKTNGNRCEETQKAGCDRSSEKTREI